MSWATSTARRRCHVDSQVPCGFQGVRGGAREAVAMVTRRRISVWRSAPAAWFSAARADAGRVTAPRAAQTHNRRAGGRFVAILLAPRRGHHWRPRPDRQPVPGCVGPACPCGLAPPGSGDAGGSIGRYARGRAERCEGRRFAGTSNLRWNPVVTAITGLSPCPWNRTRTPRECPEGSAPEGDRPTVFGTVSGSAGRRIRRGYVLAWLLSPRTHWRGIRGQKGP